MAVLKECVKVPFSLISAFYDILGHLGGVDLEPFLMLFAYASNPLAINDTLRN
jgi:hypothetical protein